MTIERLIFSPPLHAQNVHTLNLENSLLFAKRKEVPPEHKIDITPTGYHGKAILHTMSIRIHGQEETIGDLKITDDVNETTRQYPIDEQSPAIALMILNPFNVSGGINVTEVVRYIPSSGARKEMDEKNSISVPYTFVQHEEVKSTAIPVEVPIPVEIPHF
jgi:hypothetical protein